MAQEDRAALAEADGIDPGVVRKLLLGEPAPPGFVTRFQQTTPAVMARGVEDTAFYPHARLLALNAANRERAERFPLGLLTTMTHDAKRSADVRARIGALAGMASEWAEHVRRWFELNEPLRSDGGPDRVEEYLLYQTLVGAWPIEADRVEAYMEKALREGKRNTSMRILLLSWEYPPVVEGGLARAVRKLSEQLVHEGAEVHVLTRGGARLPAEEDRHGVTVHRVREPTYPKGDVEAFIRWVEDMNADMLRREGNSQPSVPRLHRSSTPFSALSCQELRRSWSPGLAGVGYVKRHVASAVAGPGPPRLSDAGGAQAPIVAAGGGSLGGARPPHAPAVAVRLPLRPDGAAEHTDSDGEASVRRAAQVQHRPKTVRAAPPPRNPGLRS